jgi:hypothetical protein
MFRGAAAMCLCICWLPAAAEIIDRIAVTVAMQVITEGQIYEEIRITAFLNREPPDFDLKQRKETCERLIEQTLIKREMELSRYPLPSRQEADSTEAEIRARYSNAGDFQRDLQLHGITEEQLKQHLWWQLTTLRFIEYRFKPSIEIPDSEVRSYYREKRAQWEREGVKNIPSLPDMRASIEQILTEQRVDQAVDRWLGDVRTQVQILYHKEAFQ